MGNVVGTSWKSTLKKDVAVNFILASILSGIIFFAILTVPWFGEYSSLDGGGFSRMQYLLDGKNSAISLLAVVVTLTVALVFTAGSIDRPKSGALDEEGPVSDDPKFVLFDWLLRGVIVLSVGVGAYSMYLVLFSIIYSTFMPESVLIALIAVLSILLGSVTKRGFLGVNWRCMA